MKLNNTQINALVNKIYNEVNKKEDKEYILTKEDKQFIKKADSIQEEREKLYQKIKSLDIEFNTLIKDKTGSGCFYYNDNVSIEKEYIQDCKNKQNQKKIISIQKIKEEIILTTIDNAGNLEELIAMVKSKL